MFLPKKLVPAYTSFLGLGTLKMMIEVYLKLEFHLLV